MTDNEIIEKALIILENRIRHGSVMNGPNKVKDYLAIQAEKNKDREAFGVMFLNENFEMIDFQYLFFGTVSKIDVYPREVVRASMQKNASAVILTHNHPNGSNVPTMTDIAITKKIKEALAFVDVVVLDHMITVGGSCVSMIEEGVI